MNAKQMLKTAQWIWPSHMHLLHNTYAHFRRDFELHRNAREAPLVISADQMYMLYVNGEYVGRGPARGYQVSWPYDEYDIARFLRKGHNWISVCAYNPGVSTFQYIHHRSAGFICAFKVAGQKVLTPDGWRMREDPSHARNTGRLSLQLNFQEDVDARMDDQAWIRAARFRKSGWCFEEGGNAYGSMPYHDMEPRDIPHLSNELLPYESLRCVGSGAAAKDHESWSNIGHGLWSEAAEMKWKDVPPQDRTMKNGEVVIPASGENGVSAVACDLGKQRFGTLQVDTSDGDASQIVDFYFTQIVDDENAPVFTSPGKGCDVALAARLRLDEKRTRHEFFQPLGHRYVVVFVRNTKRPIRMKLSLRQTIYPMDVRGTFECDDKDTHAIYEICRNTQRICSLDAYVDTPWREQAQWWGDARVQARNTFYLSGDVRLLRRGIRSIARQEVPNGLTYGHAPTIGHNCVLPDFSIVWGLTLWDDYWQSGEPTMFIEQWDRLQRLMEYFIGEGCDDNGLLRFDPRYWLFLDWAQIHREGNPALLNLWYLLLLQKLAILADVANMPDARKTFLRMEREQRKRCIDAFWNEKLGLFCDGLDEKQKRSKTHSAHSQTVAILCGLKPEMHEGMIHKRLVPWLTGEKVEGAEPSAYWLTYVFDVLQRAGYSSHVVEHIRKRWKPMIENTGTWSQFTGGLETRSCSHAWSSHPVYQLVDALAGIRQEAPGWKRIGIEPEFGVTEINELSASVPVEKGLIEVSWKRSAEGVSGKASIPSGIQAELRLPGKPAQRVRGLAKWKIESDC